MDPKDLKALAEKVDKSLANIEQKLEAKIDAHTKELEAKGSVSDELKNELQELGKNYKDALGELQSLNDQVVALQQGGSTIDTKTELKSLGAQFVESEQFKNYASGSSQRARMEFQNNTIIGEGGSPQDPTNDIVPLQTMPGIVGGAFRRLSVLDVLPRGNATGNTVHYTRENVFTNAAAETSEAGQKPETTLTFEGVDVPVRTIAHFIKVSKQVLDDAPALASYIDIRMTYGVRLRVEEQILNGDGASPNISGITTTGNHTDLPVVSGDNDFDAANRAKYQVDQADYMADFYFVNSEDWSRMERKKVGSGDDRYVGADGAISYINNGLTPMLWGLPVIITNSLAAGEFICASRDALMWWDRSTPVVEIFDQNEDDVEHNLLTVRGETRGAFTVFRPAAVVVGAWPESA
jgi:HK97 family phage major capsid protein